MWYLEATVSQLAFHFLNSMTASGYSRANVCKTDIWNTLYNYLGAVFLKYRRQHREFFEKSRRSAFS